MKKTTPTTSIFPDGDSSLLKLSFLLGSQATHNPLVNLLTCV